MERNSAFERNKRIPLFASLHFRNRNKLFCLLHLQSVFFFGTDFRYIFNRSTLKNIRSKSQKSQQPSPDNLTTLTYKSFKGQLLPKLTNYVGFRPLTTFNRQTQYTSCVTDFHMLHEPLTRFAGRGYTLR
jgi:hypothetical protein